MTVNIGIDSYFHWSCRTGVPNCSGNVNIKDGVNKIHNLERTVEVLDGDDEYFNLRTVRNHSGNCP